MIQAFKKLLRGRHNSVRHRFLTIPREWLIYALFYKLRGRTWVDFYADRLDGFAGDGSDKPIKAEYAEKGKQHLDYLISHGLKPEHKVLDYGCGFMRSGVFFAKYLENGNYTGVDISKNRLKRAHTNMAENNVAADQYNAVAVAGCSLEELGDQRFDYIWANSVLTHMPRDDIATLFSAIGGRLSPNGQFLFTFAEAETEERLGLKDFWYPRRVLAEIAENAGLDFQVVENYDPGRSDKMGLIRMSPVPGEAQT